MRFKTHFEDFILFLEGQERNFTKNGHKRTPRPYQMSYLQTPTTNSTSWRGGFLLKSSLLKKSVKYFI